VEYGVGGVSLPQDAAGRITVADTSRKLALVNRRACQGAGDWRIRAPGIFSGAGRTGLASAGLRVIRGQSAVARRKNTSLQIEHTRGFLSRSGGLGCAMLRPCDVRRVSRLPGGPSPLRFVHRGGS